MNWCKTPWQERVKGRVDGAAEQVRWDEESRAGQSSQTEEMMWATVL